MYLTVVKDPDCKVIGVVDVEVGETTAGEVQGWPDPL